MVVGGEDLRLALPSELSALRQTSRVGLVLLGDSHLARIRRDLDLLGPDVANHAVGGATAADLAGQVRRAVLSPEDVAVLSIGTNDARSGVTPGACADAVAAALDGTACSWVLVRPPLAEHAAWGDAVAQVAGATTVDTPALLADLGADAFALDGLHLSGAGYAVLVPAIAGAAGRPARLGGGMDFERSVGAVLDPVLVPMGFAAAQAGATQATFCAGHDELSERFPRLPQAFAQGSGGCIDLVVDRADRDLVVRLEGPSLVETLRELGLHEDAEAVAGLRSDRLDHALRTLADVLPRVFRAAGPTPAEPREPA